MTQIQHDRLVGLGFTLAYMGVMGGLVLSDVWGLSQARLGALLFFGAMVLVGVVVLLIAKLSPIGDR